MLEYGYMAPTMFAGLVVFLLFGFPVAFSLVGARAVLRAARRSRSATSGRSSCRRCPTGRSASCRTTCCSRSRSSPSWARSSSAAASPRTCSRAPASSSARCRGGLAYAVILVGAILGAITGTVAASVIAMGMISLPVMLRYGYDMRHRHRRDRRLRHHHPGDPAVAGADRARRPARRLGRRHVPRRDRPLDRCRSRSSCSSSSRVSIVAAAQGAGAAAGGAHAARLAADRARCSGAWCRRSC